MGCFNNYMYIQIVESLSRKCKVIKVKSILIVLKCIIGIENLK